MDEIKNINEIKAFLEAKGTNIEYNSAHFTCDVVYYDTNGYRIFPKSRIHVYFNIKNNLIIDDLVSAKPFCYCDFDTKCQEFSFSDNNLIITSKDNKYKVILV